MSGTRSFDVDDPKSREMIAAVQQFLKGFDPIKEHIPVIASAIVNELDVKKVEKILSDSCPESGSPRLEDYNPTKLVEHLSAACDKQRSLQESLKSHTELSANEKEVIMTFMLQDNISTPPLYNVIDAVAKWQNDKFKNANKPPITVTDLQNILEDYNNKAREFRLYLVRAYDSLPKHADETANREKQINLGVAYYMLQLGGKSQRPLSVVAQEIAKGLKYAPENK